MTHEEFICKTIQASKGMMAAANLPDSIVIGACIEAAERYKDVLDLNTKALRAVCFIDGKLNKIREKAAKEIKSC